MNNVKNVVLMYHSVGASNSGEKGAELYCLSVEKFRGQIEYLVRVTQSPTRPATLYIITFDDGDIKNYTNAYPALKELGLKAYFFIIASKVGTPGYMTWKQIKELADAGMVIGSHGMTHRILTELSDIELDFELSESKKMIEEKIEKKIDNLSIPKGYYNKRVIDKAREVGYGVVFTSDNRISVKASWSLEYFKRVIEKGYPFHEVAKESSKKVLKKVLGAKCYTKLRTLILK